MTMGVTQLFSARQRHLRDEPVALVLHRLARDAMPAYLGDKRVDSTAADAVPALSGPA